MTGVQTCALPILMLNDGGSVMTTLDMRGWVKSAYTSKAWEAKVDRMADEQVIALYYSLVKRGKIRGA